MQGIGRVRGMVSIFSAYLGLMWAGVESLGRQQTVYSTWGGVLEVDKCASAWVMSRFVHGAGNEGKGQNGKGKSEGGGATSQTIRGVKGQESAGPVFKFFPPGTVIKEGIQFDTTGATKYARQPGKCIMETIMSVHKLDDPALLRIAKIVRDIEVNTWSEKLTPEAAGLEAIISGLNKISKDEYECLERSFMVFDALYAEFQGKKN